MVGFFNNRIVAYWTDPVEDALVGFTNQRSYMEEMDGTPIGEMDMFSIGLLICRIDFYYNMELYE